MASWPGDRERKAVAVAVHRHTMEAASWRWRHAAARAWAVGLAVTGCHSNGRAAGEASLAAEAPSRESAAPVPDENPAEAQAEEARADEEAGTGEEAVGDEEAGTGEETGAEDASLEAKSPNGTHDSLAVAPILDASRGRRAVEDFLRSEDCAAFAEAGQFEPACNGPEALASGSFFEPGADEVLLVVMNGDDVAGGEYALALMRRKGARYRLVREMFHTGGFDARLRVVTPEGLDVLMLCQLRGHAGFYPGDCGFLGEGAFRGDEDARGAGNEFSFDRVNVCGRQSWVDLGVATLRDRRIQVDLMVVNAVLEPDGPDEGGYFCSRQTHRREKRFTLTFAITANGRKEHRTGRVRLLTPIPREVDRVLLH